MNDMERLLTRTTFLVDGLALYHSTREANHGSGAVSTRWLDIYSLLVSFLPRLGRYATLHEMYYFSAHALQLKVDDPVAMMDYRDYVSSLRASAIRVETGGDLPARFMSLLQADEFDSVVVVSSDPGIAQVLRTARNCYPHKEFFLAFPCHRQSGEPGATAGQSFTIRKKRYVKYQLPDPVIVSPDCIIHKPKDW